MENISGRTKFVTILICLMPILDPYVFLQVGGFELHVVDFLMFICCILHIFSKRSFLLNKHLFFVALTIFVANLLTFLVSSPNSSFGLSIRVWVYWIIYFVFFSTVAEDSNKEQFLKYVVLIARISTYFLLIQFLMVTIGIGVWDGQLPLMLSETDGWSQLKDITGSIRVHSFFQEPSYYAMYIMPVLAYSLKEKYVKTVVLLVVGLLISTSSMGIAGIGIIFIMWLFFEKKKNLTARQFVTLAIVIVAGVSAFAFAYNKYPIVKETVEYMIEKVLKARGDLNQAYMGSTKIRILGNIGLFENFTTFKKIFGLGINQYTLVYPSVIPYSNTMVTFLLNGGVVVALSYLFFELKLFFDSEGFNKIYPMLFILVMFTDLCIFTWYAFYLLYWILIHSKESAKNNDIRFVLGKHISSVAEECDKGE